ncbi:MAG: hypothetical protein PHD32_05775 [Eubacteriales bacterium]|nr:hypothetical protein [Eubacteriales bacterium]
MKRTVLLLMCICLCLPGGCARAKPQPTQETRQVMQLMQEMRDGGDVQEEALTRIMTLAGKLPQYQWECLNMEKFQAWVQEARLGTMNRAIRAALAQQGDIMGTTDRLARRYAQLTPEQQKQVDWEGWEALRQRELVQYAQADAPQPTCRPDEKPEGSLESQVGKQIFSMQNALLELEVPGLEMNVIQRLHYYLELNMTVWGECRDKPGEMTVQRLAQIRGRDETSVREVMDTQKLTRAQQDEALRGEARAVLDLVLKMYLECGGFEPANEGVRAYGYMKESLAPDYAYHAQHQAFEDALLDYYQLVTVMDCPYDEVWARAERLEQKAQEARQALVEIYGQP